MAWRDNLRDASFRDVPFFVTDARSTVGRRTVVHEFPGVDMPYVADLGRKGRRYKLEAFVIGEEYMSARDALRVALETPGPGPLVHPFWGQFDAVAEGEVEITETTSEGGMARFSVTLVEATDAPIQPAPQTAGELEASADVAEEALGNDFEADYSVLDAIIAAVEDAVAMIEAVVSIARKIKGAVNAALAAIDKIEGAINDLADAVEALAALPGQLVDAVVGLVDTIVSACGRVVDALGNLLDVFGTSSDENKSAEEVEATSPAEITAKGRRDRAVLLDETLEPLLAYGSDFPEIDPTTPDLEQMELNRQAMIRLVRGAAILAAARTAAKLEYASRETALRLLARLEAAIEDISATASDELYSALADLNVALGKHIRDAVAALPIVGSYTPIESVPALVVAWDLYGDATRAAEICRLNPDVRNPAVIPGGRALAVVTNG